MRCFWLAMPSALIAKTGSTQGIKFKIKPPKKAAAKATAKDVNEAVACTGAAALAASAAANAGLTAPAGSTLPTAGHSPCTGVATTRPTPSRASTTVRSATASMRWADSGKRADHDAPCQTCAPGSGSPSARTPSLCTGLLAVANTRAVCGNTFSAWPCHAAGKPCASNKTPWLSTRACSLTALLGSGNRGTAPSAAVKDAACMA